jgi:Helix-turn-helix domain of resolvase
MRPPPASSSFTGSSPLRIFERRLVAERTKDGIAAVRAKGTCPGRKPVVSENVRAALKLVDAGLSPIDAAKQLGLGRSTVYREMTFAGSPAPTDGDAAPSPFPLRSALALFI